jgi:23S rRNA (adenine2503-C2)-methyltransferase
MKKNFKELSQEELTLFVEKLGQKPYRGKQIINWIYNKFAESFDEMTDLPGEFREELKKTAYISNLHLLQKHVSSDGTQKFLFELEDGESIESVLIPNIRGTNKFTLCISSQVGCSLGCAFCATGRLGLIRNLKAYEIVDQVIAVSRMISTPAGAQQRRKDSHPSVTNIVFMGMGEPLNNFREVTSALWRITEYMGFSKRRITVSTAGIVPRIYDLAEKAPEVNLAVSLNATTDELRNRIMPVNKKYPIKKLLEACREFPLSPRRRITFEYVLIAEINDTKEDASRLVKLLGGIRAKVNLIPYNPPLLPQKEIIQSFRKPSDEKVLEFQNVLYRAGITAIIRKSMGADISAACGQLKAAYLISNY